MGGTWWRADTAESAPAGGTVNASLVRLASTSRRTVSFNCVVRIAARRDEVFTRLRAEGAGVGVHYPPNHLQPAFAAWHRFLPQRIAEARGIRDTEEAPGDEADGGIEQAS